MVFTSEGKGKSTAAFGSLLRAHGRGQRPVIFQFIKRQSANYGEHQAFAALRVPLGDGFTWRSENLDRTAALARAGWSKLRDARLSGAHGLVVLDEFTYVPNFGWVERAEAQAAFRACPQAVHLAITGRDAPSWLLDLADTATEMRKVKHAYHRGVPATPGIEL